MIDFFLASKLNTRSHCNIGKIPSTRSGLPTEQRAQLGELLTQSPTCDLCDLQGLADSALRRTGALHPEPAILAASCGLIVCPLGWCDPAGLLVDQTIFFDERLAKTRVSYVIAHEVAHYLLRNQYHEHVDVVWLTAFLLCPDPARPRSPHCPRWVRALVRGLVNQG